MDWGLGFSAEGVETHLNPGRKLRIEAEGSGFRVENSALRADGVRSRIESSGFGFGIWGLGWCRPDVLGFLFLLGFGV